MPIPRGMASATALLLQIVVTSWCATAESVLPPWPLRADFSFHGSDWTQGNCGSRRLQSPINLHAIYKPIDAEFTYSYPGLPKHDVKIINDGRVISMDVRGMDLGGLALPGGNAPWYNLTRIDIHTESEHTIRGEHAPLELQLVHEASPHLAPLAAQIVTVSVLVHCALPPQPVEQWPGFIQQHSRSHAHSANDFTIQSQGAVSSPSPAAVAASSPNSGFLAPAPMQATTTPYMNPRSTLVPGVTSLIPFATGLPTTTFAPPGFDPFFLPALQVFVQQPPPVFNDEVIIISESVPAMELGKLLEGATFFSYSGSETLPPCSENVQWLVLREPIMASNVQVHALFQQLYAISQGRGNYRTIMPQNERDVRILAAVPAQHPLLLLNCRCSRIHLYRFRETPLPLPRLLQITRRTLTCGCVMEHKPIMRL